MAHISFAASILAVFSILFPVASALLGITLCQEDIATAVSEYCHYSSTSSPQAYTSGYTVTTTSCLSTATVRSATGLGPRESQWLQTRTKSANAAMQTYLANAGTSYSTDALSKSPPRLGLAFSGGGFRAMINGAGALQAFNDQSGIPGVSGIVNSSLYVSGLSGGAWLVGTWALNNFPTVTGLVCLDC
jgi:lysophospholipase